VGIQIVYGNVSKAVDEAEQNNRPLLVYSWLPRAEIMTHDRFVRITLESFYHCDPDENTPAIPMSSSLASTIEREVVACDFPIEHVEKAVVWRLQQPSSTKAALFVNKFNLSTDQLLELLEIGAEWKESSSSSAAELDHIACLWLNNNTPAWEGWLPDVALYKTEFYNWEAWLLRCSFYEATAIGFITGIDNSQSGNWLVPRPR
jgi:ABC-type proline/glycine betaine transport system substrate-binding protein